MDEVGTFEPETLGQSSRAQVQNHSGTEDQGIRDFLTPDLQKLLDKELEILDKERSQELALLKKDLATESKLLKDWGFPTDSSYESCRHDAVNKAKSWLDEKQHDLEEIVNTLTRNKEQKQEAIDAKLGEIAQLENDIKSLLSQLTAFRGEVQNAKEEVKRLSKELEGENAPPEGSLRRKLLESQRDAAQTRLQQLCGTKDPEEECKPDFENQFHAAVSETLEGWRQARSELRALAAKRDDCPKPDGSPEADISLESIEVCIKKYQKQLEYIKTYETVLIVKYIADSLKDECATYRTLESS